MTGPSPEEFLPLKPKDFHILLTVADRPVHGYGIREEVDERTGGRIVLAAGTLYETLQRLQDRGLIDEVEVPPEAAERASSRWRFYGVTPLGRAVLEREVERLEEDLAAARSLL